MFWSPAVTTFKATDCCAFPGWLKASMASVAKTMLIRCMTPPVDLLRVLSRIKMQRRCRKRDTDCVTDRQPALVVHQILVRSDADRIAVKASGIRSLGDPPAQHQAAVEQLIGWAEPRLLAAEVSYCRGGRGHLPNAVGNEARLLDGDATVERTFGDDDLPFGAADRQWHDIGGAHKAGDERRVWPIVNLLRSADLRDMPGIEDGDAVGHYHRFLAVMRDVHGGDAKILLQCLD